MAYEIVREAYENPSAVMFLGVMTYLSVKALIDIGIFDRNIPKDIPLRRPIEESPQEDQ